MQSQRIWCYAVEHGSQGWVVGGHVQADGDVKRREQDRRKNTIPSTTLFVVNFDVTRIQERDLADLFDRYGRLTRVQIKKNFAFVQVRHLHRGSVVPQFCAANFKHDPLSFYRSQIVLIPSPLLPQRIAPDFTYCGNMRVIHLPQHASPAAFTHRSAIALMQLLFGLRSALRRNCSWSAAHPAILDTAGPEQALGLAAQFEDLEDAKDAMQGVNQLEYKGRILTVEYVAREANGRCRLCVD